MAEDRGVGQCPDRPDGWGHVWKSWKVDSRRPCEFCGRPGRDNTPIGGEHDTGGFFAQATQGRYGLVAFLNKPMTFGSGKPRELTPEQQARADAIVEDKRRRDAEAVANGTARPGQVAGAKGKK